MSPLASVVASFEMVDEKENVPPRVEAICSGDRDVLYAGGRRRGYERRRKERDTEHDARPHPDTPPRSRMKCAPTSIAATAKTTAPMTGDRSHERS